MSAQGNSTQPGEVPELIRKLLRLGPALLAEAAPAHFPSVEVAVEFWRRTWAALRLEERYQPLTGLDLYRIAPTVSGEMLAIKAALKDQEKAGIDIVSDGELRRDNDIDYLLARIPGVQIPVTVKSFYYDYYDAVVADPPPTDPLPTDPPPLGLADDYRFTRQHTDRPVKVLVHRALLAVSPDPEQGVF